MDLNDIRKELENYKLTEKDLCHVDDPVKSAKKNTEMKAVSETKKCRHCAMYIPKAAKICPYCRKKIGLTLPAKVFLGLFAIGFLAAMCGKGNTPSAPPPSPAEIAQRAKEQERDDAKFMAKEFVEKSLKAPSTAKFQSTYDFAASQEKNGNWKVYGYVDAQNSFGAMLRNKFLVTMKKKGDQWFLVDLNMWE